MNDHYCKYEAEIATMGQSMKLMVERQEDMGEKLDRLVEAACGTPDGSVRGHNVRLTILEQWKSIVNKVFGTILFLGAGALITLGLTKILG